MWGDVLPTRMRAGLSLLIVAGLVGSFAAGCSGADSAGDATDVAEQNASTIDGNGVFTKLVAELAADPQASVRSAIDRAVNAQKNLGVQPYPGSCSPIPERLYWNGEDQAFARLGVVAVADLLVLEARTQGPLDTSKLGRSPVRSHAELVRAIEVLAKAESPALLAEGVAMLTQSRDVKDADLRALLAFTLDVEETKRFRDPTGALRLPNLASPPTEAAILERLRSSPILSMRAAAPSYAERAGIALSPARVDAILDDASYRVRAEAGGIFWRGSDASPTRLRAVIARFGSPESRAQMRADTLREDYGVREEEAGAWSDLPAGIERRIAESIGGFVGRALETAPAGADITPLLDVAATASNVSDLVETAIDAILRTKTMDRAAKIKALGALVKPAANAAWDNRTTPLVRLASALTPLLIDAPLSQLGSPALVTQIDQSFGFALATTWPAVRAELDSTDPALRLGALAKMAVATNATEATGIQIVLLRRPDLPPATRIAILDAVEKGIYGGDLPAVFQAARDTGTDPRDVLARIKRMLGSLPPNFRPWGSIAQAYAEAAGDPRLSADEMVTAITEFLGALDPISLADPNAPGAGPLGPTVGREAYAMVRLLDQPRVAHSKRLAAWKSILVRPDGLRHSLLASLPTTDEGRQALAEIVTPFLVQPVATCWQGRMEISNPRPAIILSLVPYVLAPPTIAVDPAAVTAGRVAKVRAESSALADLPAGAPTTRAALYAAVPKWKDSDLGNDMWDAPERAKLRAPAADVATELLASPAGADVQTIAATVHRLGYARGFRDLPAAKLTEVEAFVEQRIAPAAAAAQYLFFLRVERGDGYDALATKFRHRIGFRWDLGDAARPRGEQAALEAILGSVGTGFGTLGSVLALSSQAVSGANVTPSFRQGLLEYGAETERFWGTRGQWATGLLPITRAVDSDLSFVVRGDMNRPIVTSSPSGDSRILRESSLYGDVASDPRLPAPLAVTLAWNRLSHGKIAMRFEGAPKLHITLLVDTVLGVMSRPDISAADKAALGKALRYDLE